MRALRAFLSYRRGDTFAQADDGAGEDAFLERVIAALRDLHFDEVFLDKPKHGRRERGRRRFRVTRIAPGDHFENRIVRAIDRSDIFFPVIGPEWLRILKEKADAGESDVLLREIRGAFNLDKQVIPILVDGAKMPAPGDLPKAIAALSLTDAIALESSASPEEIAAALRGAVDDVREEIVLGPGWAFAYFLASALAYYFVAVEPHRVGWFEYGAAWPTLAGIWGGLFIWPVVFLPPAQLAFFRPVTILVEQALNAETWRERLTFLTPFAAGFVLAALAISIEVTSDNVPWTVQVRPDACGEADGASRFCALEDYDADGELAARYGEDPPFWLRDKSWPGAFYYLTKPIAEGVDDDAYWAARAPVQTAFAAAMNHDSIGDGQVMFSRTFWTYAVSFAILVLYAAVGFATAIIFAVARLRRAYSDTELATPREDTFLALSFAFITLMIWVPFRMVTVYFKTTYLCGAEALCRVEPIHYLNDAVFAVVLGIGYLILMAMLTVRFGRLGVAFVGAMAVAMICGLAYAVYANAQFIATLVGHWQFYVGVSIPCLLVLLALWFQFDPTTIRLRDFRKRLDPRRAA